MALDKHTDRVVRAVAKLDRTQQRQLVAISGPPASGKSTLAAQVQHSLQAASVPCGLVPMDGFHLDNDCLERRGLLHRKGAPETFDAEGFGALVARLAQEDEVAVPAFDRIEDRVIQNATRIMATDRVVLVEGNYLFLNAPHWRDLAHYWSLSVFLRPGIEVLKARLLQRWLDHGLDQKAAEARATGNDLVNARLVLEQSCMSAVDIVLD